MGDWLAALRRQVDAIRTLGGGPDSTTYQSVGGQDFKLPHFGLDEHGAVVAEWICRDRSLGIYFTDPPWYLKCWTEGGQTVMQDGDLVGADDVDQLLEWLQEAP